MHKKEYTAVGRHRNIKLHWVKGHSEVLGNELADRAADRGRTALFSTGGSCSTPDIFDIDLNSVVATGLRQLTGADLFFLQKIISTVAETAFAPVVREARKPWISQNTFALMNKEAVTRNWGHTAQEANIQKLIKK